MVESSDSHPHLSGTLHAGRSRAALSSRPDGATDELGAEASGYVGGDEQLGQVASGLGSSPLWIKDSVFNGHQWTSITLAIISMK